MRISDEQRARIRRLFYAEHWKIGTIATQLGLHPDTVRRAVKAECFNNRGKSRPSALDPFVDFVRDTLRQYPTLTATRVHEMLRQRGYDGSVIQLRRRIRQLDLRPKPRSEAYFRLPVRPAEQAQVDWGYFGRLRVGNTERKLWVFVMTLSWSRAVHAYFSFDQSIESVLRGHIACFEAFGGVPRTILYDNMKTVVVERVGDAIRFHPRLLELAGHYLFDAYPCNPRRAHEKGRVERAIQYLRTSFFAGRHFTSRRDLAEQFTRWRDDVAYTRPCPGDRNLTVGEAFAREHEALRPLPKHRLDTDEIRAVQPRKQPYVRYDTNDYSFPHVLVDEPLTVAAGDERVRIFHGDELVADHARSWERHRTIEDPAHFEGLGELKRKARPLHGRARLIAEAPATEELLDELARRDEPLGTQTRKLLELLGFYGADRLDEAAREALERGTPRAASVAYLLEHQDRQQGRPPTVPTRVSDSPEIQNLTVEHHDLESYDDLSQDRDHDDSES